jgi:NADPH-dependent 2,4-dienoyl-CoA reductase/sulfur reductase-like enzyme
MSGRRVVVVGAGPAGMAAAVRAQENGARVTLIDDNAAAGGQIWRGGSQSIWFELLRDARVQMLTGAQVVSGDLDSKTLLIEQAQRPLEISFDKLILATGARELFLPFPGWTLPGIFGAGGLQALAKSGWPIRGKRIVVAGTGPLLLAVAVYLRTHGAKVTLLAEQADRSTVMGFAFGLLRQPEKLAQAAGLQFALTGIRQRYGCWVESAEGDGKLELLRIRQRGKIRLERCDFAAIAYGLCPNIELASLFGCRVNNDGTLPCIDVDEFQQSSIPDILCAGECTGIGGVELSLIEGEIAGYAASEAFDKASALFTQRSEANRFAQALDAAFALRPELKELPKPETLVCRCEDVSFAQLQEYSSFRAARLHTRCGMGACQGRICGPAARFLLGWERASLRPPILATRIGTLLQESTKQ